jgi:hypothetical protein
MRRDFSGTASFTPWLIQSSRRTDKRQRLARRDQNCYEKK